MVRKINKKAFTLIELLIYSGIAALLMGGLILVSINMLQARSKSTTIEKINHSARFTVERINYHIRQAQEIVSPSLGNSSPFLKIIDPDGNEVTFSVSLDGILEIDKTGEETNSLTIDSAIITNLEFINVSQLEGVGGSIKMTMTIEHKNPSGRRELNFGKTIHSTENIRR